MNRINKFLCGAIALLLLVACDNTEYTAGVWYKRSDFVGSPRYDAAGFVIGNMGYLCTGYKQYGSGDDDNHRMKDCWRYDIEKNQWTQMVSMPDEAPVRSGATGFSVGTKGYIASGYRQYKIENNDPDEGFLRDCWEFDPSGTTEDASLSGSWKQMDDIPNVGTTPGARRYALSFGIGNYGYLGCGYSDINSTSTDGYAGYLSDFFRFNPTAASGSQWTSIGQLPGTKRQGAWVFVIDDVAYVGGGENNGADVDDFWRFDPSSDPMWTELRKIIDDDKNEDFDDDYTDIRRCFAGAFVIDGRGYLCVGRTAGYSLRSSYWIYDPQRDLWYDEWTDEDLTTFTVDGKASARYSVVSFSTGTRGFVATGAAGGSTSVSYLDDVWELKPYEYYEQ